MDDGGTGAERSLADQRRAQVLEAAAKCFDREGFHGASMASIANEAALSVGQIYRYFPGKDAVIEALVAQYMDAWIARMFELRARASDPVDELIEMARYHAEKIEGAEAAALSLEFLAEAARNPRIAHIVQGVDKGIREHLTKIFLRAGAVDDADLPARVSMAANLLDGWVVRSVKNPAADREEYLAALRPLLAMLLQPQRLSQEL